MYITHLPRTVAEPLPSSMFVAGLVGVQCADKGGHALQAKRPFAAGELLVVWGGAVLNARQLEPLLPDVARLTLQIDEDAFLVTTVEGPGDWVNHSCDPNGWLDGQVSLIARRDIEVGEEITFDYATSDSCPYDEFDCCCGSVLCRGALRGDDWMRPDLRERYQGHFSPYLQRRLLARRAGDFRAA